MRKSGLSVLLLLAVGFAFCQFPLQLLHNLESPFESASFEWGGKVDGNGDINGDGFDDIIIQGRPAGSALGRRDVYIYLGGNTLGNTTDLIIPDPAIPGPHNLFGSSIAYDGDINGDGYCDLVVGEPRYGEIEKWGRVHVYWGGPSFDTTVDVIIDGLSYGYISFGLNFGANVDISGDFNGDGCNDLVVYSAHGNMCQYGQVDVFFGGPGFDLVCDWHRHGEMGERFGISLAAGDLNGDGSSDLATWSMPFDEADPQSLNIFLGGADFDALADATYLFAQDFYWPALAMNADLDLDGCDDLLVVNSQNRILWGSPGLTNGLIALDLPSIGSQPAYYASSDGTTYIVNGLSSNNPPHMEYYLSSFAPGGQFVNDYSYAYSPASISDCAYGYWLGDVNNDGNTDLLVTTRTDSSVVFQIITTAVDQDAPEDNNVSPVPSLSACPNPFFHVSDLSFELKQPGRVLLSVYNLRGQRVAVLEDAYLAAGQHTVQWNGRDAQGVRQAPGVYLIRLQLDQGPPILKKVTLTD